MTDIDTKALALIRAAQTIDTDADIFAKSYAEDMELQFPLYMTIAEARVLASFLREAAEGERRITPEQLSRAMRPDMWADDCGDMVVPRDGQSKDDVISLVRETHMRWAEDAIARLYASPAAGGKNAE